MIHISYIIIYLSVNITYVFLELLHQFQGYDITQSQTVCLCSTSAMSNPARSSQWQIVCQSPAHTSVPALEISIFYSLVYILQNIYISSAYVVQCIKYWVTQYDLNTQLCYCCCYHGSTAWSDQHNAGTTSSPTANQIWEQWGSQSSGEKSSHFSLLWNCSDVLYF